MPFHQYKLFPDDCLHFLQTPAHGFVLLIFLLNCPKVSSQIICDKHNIIWCGRTLCLWRNRFQPLTASPICKPMVKSWCGMFERASENKVVKRNWLCSTGSADFQGALPAEDVAHKLRDAARWEVTNGRCIPAQSRRGPASHPIVENGERKPHLFSRQPFFPSYWLRSV